MQVVAHHGVRANVDRKDVAEDLQTLDYPRFAVIEVASSERIPAAKKCAAHAARDAVVV
jgi:hypothetical protein